MKDTLFTTVQMDKWRQFWPHAEVVAFPDSGHLVFEEQPNEFEAAVYMFQAGQSELANTSQAIHGDLMP